MASANGPNVLLVGNAQRRAAQVCNLLRERGVPVDRRGIEPVLERRDLRCVDLLVCVLDPQGRESDVERLRALLQEAQAEKVATLLWGTPDNLESPDGELIDCLPADVGLEEVIGRLTALARYAPALKRMEKELERLERLGRQLNRYFDEVDHELRLAGRLQHDFLPRQMPRAPGLRFAHVYRPAGWVSGDIYDIFEIDARHIGLFIADAMGHGTAAGLMTMFLRRALVPVRPEAGTTRILTPAEVMRELHEGLARQDLPHAQFVTATYAIVDLQRLELRVARGGHPYPLHIDGAGQIAEIRCDGGLLGVAGLEPHFEERSARLVPGEKIVLYTDGLEELFIAARDRQTEQPRFTDCLRRWACLGADALARTIHDHLDRQEGSLNPADDVTLLVLEVAV